MLTMCNEYNKIKKNCEGVIFMQYLKRKIDRYLDDWKKDSDRKPLIIKGARQIGKTESIRTFAKQNYDNIIEINFVEEPRFKTITQDGYSVEQVVKAITRIEPSFDIVPDKTLLFFDEIQSCSDIVTALKFFKIDGNYDVICSGSLLGVNYKQIESISVGYKIDYEMYSMDFEEFLWAYGYGEDLITELLEHMLNTSALNTSVFNSMDSLFLDYIIIGGMPEVVGKYINNKTFSGTLENQRQIIMAYKEDIRKYVNGADQTRITRIFDSIPLQLAKDNKKFQISKVASGARFHDYAGCIEWLKDAGIINICYCLNYPELPLRGNYDSSKFKVYYADNGLLVSMLDDEASDDLRSNKNMDVYKGALYESIVAEALKKSGYDLYYYKREDSTLEEDFFIRSQKCMVPIEVKSRGGRSKSMRTLIDSDKYSDIKYGIKLSHNNIGHEGKIYTFPYFCSFLIKRFMKEFEAEEEML